MNLSFITGRWKSWHILLLFASLSVILRLFSFFPSVIDHDESTYLEIAREMLEGKMLYVDLIDIKPPGIFLILAGFGAVFGHSIFFIRFLVALWIAVTAFMIYLSCKLLFKNQKTSIAAGTIYIFFISTWSFYGISITPEIFFNLFTISALYILLRVKSGGKYFFAGLTAGVGFIVKYFVMLDYAVFVLFLILLENNGKDVRLLNAKKIIPLLAAGIGFFLPFALINLYYLYRGNYDALVNVVYMAPQRYPNPINAIKMPLFILDFQLRFFPIFLFFYYSLFEKSLRIEGSRPVKAMLLLWSVAALMAVIISGNHYGHYTIQLMLPVSLMAGLFFHEDMVLPAYLRWITLRRTGLIVLPLLVLGISALKLEYVVRRDVPREIAAYLKPRLKESDIIYTGNYHHIIYYLLSFDSPTPYVHRSILEDERHLNALNIDQNTEFEKIIRKNPKFILTQKEYPVGIMKDFISQNYKLDKDFGQGIRLWKRIE